MGLPLSWGKEQIFYVTFATDSVQNTDSAKIFLSQPLLGMKTIYDDVPMTYVNSIHETALRTFGHTPTKGPNRDSLYLRELHITKIPFA